MQIELTDFRLDWTPARARMRKAFRSVLELSFFFSLPVLCEFVSNNFAPRPDCVFEPTPFGKVLSKICNSHDVEFQLCFPPKFRRLHPKSKVISLAVWFRHVDMLSCDRPK